MTDWEKWKVVDLKEELKSRGIPLTGLKLKQQLIDKLNEVDSEGSEHKSVPIAQDAGAPKIEKEPGNDEDQTTTPAQQAVSASRSSEPDDTIQTGTNVEAATSINKPTEPNDALSQDAKGEERSSTTPADQVTGAERVERLPDNLPAELKKEESQARDGEEIPPDEIEIVPKESATMSDSLFVPQPLHPDPMEVESPNSIGEIALGDRTALQSSKDVGEKVGTPEAVPSSRRLPTLEVLDDRYKRKRRCVSPVPGASDVVHKRAKVDDNMSVVIRRESDVLEKVQAATDDAQAMRDLDASGDADMKTQSDIEGKNTTLRREKSSPEGKQTKAISPNKQPLRRSSSSPDSRAERDISPALHPATRSLYMRNFKRPLHLPTLRNHISKIASSSGEDPVKVFYLDSIRTHAYVSLESESAASRVRNAMHGIRFPNERMRDALWIDFIPDEKVQSWIDEETGGSGGGFGGGRGSFKKFEVAFHTGVEGVTATLEETSGLGSQPKRSGVQVSRPNPMSTQDPTASAAIASGIHPSRASIATASFMPSRPQQQSHGQGLTQPSDLGKGFRALDELFSSTNAKPKLYYKLPAQAVIDERLDMIRELRVNHDQMGQSGDEGMKRYSFEQGSHGEREVWVDKGPEFGFGRRGQERLTGFGSSYTGTRGRGGLRGGRRGGDSWRGR